MYDSAIMGSCVFCRSSFFVAVVDMFQMVLGWPILSFGKLLLLTSKISKIFVVYQKTKFSSILNITLKWGIIHNSDIIKYSSIFAKQLIATVLGKLPYMRMSSIHFLEE
jgi:hypothetical protein